MKSGSIRRSQIPSQKTSPGRLSFVYQTIIAPHTGQSSQLVVDADDRDARFLATVARSVLTRHDHSTRPKPAASCSRGFASDYLRLPNVSSHIIFIKTPPNRASPIPSAPIPPPTATSKYSPPPSRAKPNNVTNDVKTTVETSWPSPAAPPLG